MSELEITKIIDVNFDEAEKRVVSSLKEQGFGILTEIDVKSVMKTKINADFEKYKILGACNPVLAKKGLDLDRKLGVLLPCNVYVQEIEKNKTKIAVINPEAMFSVLEKEKFKDLVKEVKTKVESAILSLK